MKMIFWAFAIISGFFLQGQAFADTKFEAENATLSGGANSDNNHSGFSGAGFVVGYYNSSTAMTTFNINGATTGTYTVTLHYSAGNGTTTTIGLYVNGVKIKNITCNATADWNTWADEVETVTFLTGSNTLAYKAETANNSCINLDYISVNGILDPCAGVLAGGGDASLAGTTFGLTPPWSTNSEYCKAADGDINTFYDYSQANGGYTGLDLGSAKVIKRIRYYPRSNAANRMVGGKFQGSNDKSTYTDLYTISSTPQVQGNEVAISNSTGYRYVRYLGPDGGFCNIAEMEFYDTPPSYSLSMSSGGNGTTNPPGNVSVYSGTPTSISATPSPGYSFTKWKVTSAIGTATIADTNSSSTTVTLLSGNATIQAQFSQHSPSNFYLSNSSVPDGTPSNSPVGTFSAQDVDYQENFTYSLVNDSVPNDNGSFGIDGSILNIHSDGPTMDYSKKSSYRACVQVQDYAGNKVNKMFTISVIPAYANPTVTPAPGTVLSGSTAENISWTRVAGGMSYKLDIGSVAGSSDIYSGTEGPDTSAIVYGLPHDGSTLYVRLVTNRLDGPHLYNFTYTAYLEKPNAFNVAITGTHKIGQVDTGTYTYFDANNDSEGTTTFKWYRADDASGTNKTEITGATNTSYTIVDADEGKYLLFEVTPRTKTGVVGNPTLSSAVGPVASCDGFVYVFPKFCGDSMNMKVNGRIKCNSLLIHNWLLSQNGAAPDYVFDKDYKMPTLNETEQYIKANGHLPEVPSAKELETKGVDMIQLNFVLLKKIEEMTLHMIAQEKEIAELKNERKR